MSAISHTCSQCGNIDSLTEREAIIARLTEIVNNPEEKSQNVIFSGEKLLRELAADRKEGVGQQNIAHYKPEWVVAQLREVHESFKGK